MVLPIPILGVAVLASAVGLVVLRQRARSTSEGGGGGVGAAGRVLFGQPQAGTISIAPADTYEAPAQTLPFTNLLRVRGRFVSPTTGEKVSSGLLETTYPIVVSLLNQGDRPLTDRVVVELFEDHLIGGSASGRVASEPVTLPVNEAVRVTLRAAEAGFDPRPGGTPVNARLRFAGFTLSRVDFLRT